MNSPTLAALLILCSAGLHAQGFTTPATAGISSPADPTTEAGNLAPWRTTFNSTKVTLGQVRFVFLHQDVIVSGTIEDLGSSSQLLEWRIAAKTAASIQADIAGDQKVPHS